MLLITLDMIEPPDPIDEELMCLGSPRDVIPPNRVLLGIPTTDDDGEVEVVPKKLHLEAELGEAVGDVFVIPPNSI